MDMEDCKEEIFEKSLLQVTNLNPQLENVTKENDDMELAIEANETEMAQFKEALDLKQQEAIDDKAQVHKLSGDVQSLETLVAETKATLTECEQREGELEGKNDEITQASEALEQLKPEKELVLSKTIVLEEKLASPIASADNQTTQLAELNEKCVLSLPEHVDRLVETLSAAQEESALKANSCKHFEQDFKISQDELEKLKEESANAVAQQVEKTEQLCKESEAKTSRIADLETLSLVENLKYQLEESKAVGEGQMVQHTREIETLKSKLDIFQMDLEEKEAIVDANAGEISFLRDQTKTLQMELEERELEVKEFESTVSDLQNQLSELQEERSNLCSQSEQEVASLKSKLDLLHMDLEGKEQSLLTSNEQIGLLKSHLETASKERDNAQQALEREQILLSEMREKNNDLQKEKDESSQKVQELSESLDNLSQQIKELQQAKTETSSQFKQETEDLKSKLEMMHMDLEDKEETVQNFVSQVSILNLQLENMTKENNEMKLAIEANETEMAQLKEALDLKQQETIDAKAQVAKLSEDVQSLQTLLEKTKAALKECEQREGQLRGEFEGKKVEITQVSDALEQLKSEKELLLSKTLVLEEKLASQTASADNHTTQLAELNEKCVFLSEHVDRLVENLSAAQEESVSQANSCKQFEQDLKISQDELEKLKEESANEVAKHVEKAEQLCKESEAKTSRIADLETLVEDLKHQLEESKTVEGQLVQHKQETESLKSKLDMLQVDLEDKKAIVDANANKISSLEDQIETLTEEGEALKNSAELSSVEMSSLQDKLQNLQKELEVKEQKVKELELMESAVSDLQNQLSGLQDEKSNLCSQSDQEVGSLKSKLDLLQMDLEEKEESLKKYSDQCANLNARLETAIQERYEAQSNLEGEKQEMIKINSKFMEVQREMDEKSQKVTELNETLHDVRRQLDDHKQLRITEAKTDLSSLNDQDLGSLKSEFDLLQMHLEEKKATVQDLSNKLSNLEMYLQKVSKERDEAVDSSQTLQFELSEMGILLEIEKDEANQRSKEVSILKDQLANLEGVLAKGDTERLAARVTALQDSLSSERDQVVAKTAEVEELNKKCLILSEELEIAKIDASEKQMELELNLQKTSEQSEEHEHFHREINDLETHVMKMADSKQKLEELQIEFDGKCLKVQEMEKEVLYLKNKYEQSESDRSTENLRHNQEVDSLKSKMDVLQRDIEDKERTIAEVSSELEHLKHSFQVNIENEKSTTDCARCCTNDDAGSTGLQEQVSCLETSLGEAELRNRALKEKLEGFMVDTQEVSGQLVQLQSHIDVLSDKLEAKKREVLARVNQLAKKEEELDEVRGQLKVKEMELVETNSTISKLKEDLKEFKSTVGTLEDAIESLNFDLAEAEKEKVSLISTNSDLKTQLSVAEGNVQTLTEQLDTDKSLQVFNNEQLQDLTRKHDEAVLTVGSLEYENAELKNQILNYKTELKDLTEHYGNVKNNLRADKENKEELELKMESIEAEHKLQIKQLDESNKQLERLKDLEITLRAELTESNAVIDKLQKNVDKKTSLLEQIQFKITEGNKEIQNVKEDLEAKMKELKGWKLAYSEQEQANAALILERDELKEQVELFDSVKQEKCQIEKELDNLKAIHKNNEEAHIIEKDIWQEKLSNLEGLRVELENRLKKIQCFLEMEENIDGSVSLENQLQFLIEKSKKSEERKAEMEKQLCLIEQELQNACCDKSCLEKKMETLNSAFIGCQKDLSEKEKCLQASIDQQSTLADKLKLLEASATSTVYLEDAINKLKQENERLTDDLKTAQESGKSSNQHLESLKKWEQRCSDLKNALTMERKKSQRLEELVKKLKEADSPCTDQPDKESLQAELATVIEERDGLREECNKFSQEFRKKVDKVRELENRLRLAEGLLKRQQNEKKLKASNDSTETQPGVPSSAGSSANSTPSTIDLKTLSSTASLSASKNSFHDNKELNVPKASKENNSCKQGAMPLEKPVEQKLETRGKKHSLNAVDSTDHSNPKCQKQTTSPTAAASSQELSHSNVSLQRESPRKSLSVSSGRRMTRSSTSLLEPALISPTSSYCAENSRKESPSAPPYDQSGEGKISPRITRKMSLNKSKSTAALPTYSEGRKVNISSGDTWATNQLSQGSSERLSSKEVSSASAQFDLSGQSSNSKSSGSSSVLGTITNSAKEKTSCNSSIGSRDFPPPRGFKRSRLKSVTPLSEKTPQVTSGLNVDDKPDECATQ